MSKLLRTLAVLSIALACVVTSVGWAMPGSHSATVMHHTSEAHSECIKGVPSSEKSDVVGCAFDEGHCGEDQPQDGPEFTCCAFACHMAIPALFGTDPPAKAPRFIGHSGLAVGLSEAARVRLERPPRIFSI